MLNLFCGAPAAPTILDEIGKIGPVAIAAIVAIIGWLQFQNGKAAAGRAHSLAIRQHELDEKEFRMQLLAQRRIHYDNISRLNDRVWDQWKITKGDFEIISEIYRASTFLFPQYVVEAAGQARMELAQGYNQYLTRPLSVEERIKFIAVFAELMTKMAESMRITDD